MQRKPTKRQLAAWREARMAHYANTRSAQSLAAMVVDLEDDNGCVPEFEIDEEWPESVRSFKEAR